MSEASKKVREIFEALEPEEREAVMVDVGEVYCQHCWNKQPDSFRKCQCFYDE